MKKGTVKWFNTTKGYGFITSDEGGNDIFVHISGFASKSLTTLAEGQKVTFDTEVDAKSGKTRAVNVSLA